MKFFIFLAAATVMLSWTAVHAADDDVVVQRSTHKIVEEDSSEHNRMGKKFSITAQLFGTGANNACITTTTIPWSPSVLTVNHWTPRC